MKLYCQDCEILVCRDCVLVKHKNHNYTFVDDIVEDEKQKLEDVTLQELHEILTSTKEAIYDVEQMQAKVHSWSDQHITHLNKTSQEMTNMVKKRENNILSEIEKITNSTLSPLLKQQDVLTVLERNIEKCYDFTSSTLHNGTSSEILSARKQMLERTKHLKNLHGNSKLSPVTKPTKTICYQLGKINLEIEQVAIFVDLQQCSIEDVICMIKAGTTQLT